MKAFLICLLIAGVLFAQGGADAQNASAARWKEVKIYLVKNTGDGPADNPHNFHPVVRRVSARNPLRAALVALTDGPTAAEERKDLVSPTFGIRLLSVKLKAGVAYTYFTMPEGAAFSGDTSPFIFQEAVIKTASQFPDVPKVVVCLDGDLDFGSEAEGPPQKCPKV
jgi:spore germination protein GerM